MSAPTWTPTISRWVDAAPFSALLEHLAETTGLEAEILGIPLDIPLRTTAALVGPRRNRPRRIRWCDARNISNATRAQILREANTMVSAAPVIQIVRCLPEPVRQVRYLVTQLGVGSADARALLAGWLTQCPSRVAWRARVLAGQLCVMGMNSAAFELAA